MERNTLKAIYREGGRASADIPALVHLEINGVPISHVRGMNVSNGELSSTVTLIFEVENIDMRVVDDDEARAILGGVAPKEIAKP